MDLLAAVSEHFLLSRSGRKLVTLIFFLQAAVIVYPDVCLTWLSSKTGRIYRIPDLIGLEILAVSLSFGLVLLLNQRAQITYWWIPAGSIAFLGIIRFIKSIIEEIFR